MKLFLRKISIFLVLPFIYFGANMLTNYFIYSNQSVSIKQTRVLIAGDSHPQKSLNPKYFNDAQNIAQEAEPYILTYWKLKHIFKSYTPDTLIIGFAPHNISQFNDLKFSNRKWSSEMFRRCYPIQEFSKISNTVDVDYKIFFKTLWKQTAFYPKIHHTNYIGSYSNTKNNNINDWKKVINRHYYQNGIELSFSQLSIDYLDSIINLTNLKNIKLILVNHPVHKNYLNNIPESILQKHMELSHKYAEKYVVFDKATAIYPDSLYLNSDHLNADGAKRFTEELIKYLKNKQN